MTQGARLRLSAVEAFEEGCRIVRKATFMPGSPAAR